MTGRMSGFMRGQRHVRRLVALLALLLVSATATVAQEWQRLINSDQEPQNWLSYGGNYSAHRYSALNQINRTNVKNLTPVWLCFNTGEVGGRPECHTHRRRRRAVSDGTEKPRLRVECSDRRDALEILSTSFRLRTSPISRARAAGHRARHASISARSTITSSRWTPKPGASCGMSKSKTPSSAAATSLRRPDRQRQSHRRRHGRRTRASRLPERL
jgi:hypothetical protein